jgi:hypothetical protein
MRTVNIIEKNIIIIPKPNIFTETRTQDTFLVYDLNSCNLLQNPSSPRLELRTDFRGCGLCSCNLPADTNNFGIDAVLLPCLVSELHKPSSPGLKPRTDFRGCGLFSCNLPAKTNHFRLSAVLLSCLVFELQKSSSPGIEPRTVFGGCSLCFCNLLFEAKNLSLGAVLLCCLVLNYHRDSNSGQFFGVLTSLKSLSGLKE